MNFQFDCDFSFEKMREFTCDYTLTLSYMSMHINNGKEKQQMQIKLLIIIDQCNELVY